MDDPIQLPGGRLICGRHGLVICGSCCVDYSFMDEVLQYSDSDDSDEQSIPPLFFPVNAVGHDDSRDPDQPHPFSAFGTILATPESLRPDGDFRRGTGQVLPSRFVPPSSRSTPAELFPPAVSTHAIPPVIRFIRRNNPDQFLIFTDGACLGNGQPDPKAGWAFVFKPATDHHSGLASGRLENEGPFGDEEIQTSNRAELRAVLAALSFRHWPGEGFTTLVVATDSEYVARGATEWVHGWVRNGWTTRSRTGVKNRDLWEMLLGECERWDEHGFRIEFWRIPRAMNTAADRAAKRAAEGEDRDMYCDIKGVLV